jgi:hypothetical protein
MKNLIYLFAAVIMFAFTACGGGDTATEEAAPAAEEVVAEEVVAEEVVAEEVVAEEVVAEEEATE